MSPDAYAALGLPGLGWYARAEKAIALAARDLGTSPDTFARVLSASSPRLHVRANVRWTLGYLAGEPPFRLMGAVQKSVNRVASGGPFGQRAFKTMRFAHALTGDTEAVVLDVWALRALSEPADRSPGAKRYRELERLVRALARRSGVSPRDYQAMMWVGAMRASGRRTIPDMAAVIGEEMEARC